jgi:D-serine deaminase-like pyridoxal phosphate-dependent protein
MSRAWYAVDNIAEISTPALLVYPARVDENLRRMIAGAGGVDRLRPHVKTHKMPAVVRRKLALGITKFKCATIAEAEMLGQCEAPDVLLAYQPVGPNAARLARLAVAYPATRFSAVADDEAAVRTLSAALSDVGRTVEVLLDLDVGMHRTGISPGPAAVALYRLIASLPGLAPGGLHAYDGHIRSSSLSDRANETAQAFQGIADFHQKLTAAGLDVPRIVGGGSPTFPIHALNAAYECSPGTTVFWDHSYGTRYPDMDYISAALVVTRVVSRPTANRLCLDLGYKAVSPDNPDKRVHLLDLVDAQPVVHSEEHLVVESSNAANFDVGDVLYGVPFHICPTVALHEAAVTVREHSADGLWPIVARDRRLTI